MQVHGSDATIFDMRGLQCPALGRRVRKALSRARPGELLRFICSDPLSVIDVPHIVTQLGDAVAGETRDAQLRIFTVRKRIQA